VNPGAPEGLAVPAHTIKSKDKKEIAN
jgi:hypothetical protein